MDDDDCPQCGHAWRLHPGANLSLLVCGECIYEEDYDLRSVVDMCRLEPPGIGDAPAPHGDLRARIQRSVVRRRFQMSIVGPMGLPWATVTPPSNTREAAEKVASIAEGDIASLSLGQLRGKYRPEG